MKLLTNRKKSEAGSVLATTLVITFVIGVTLATLGAMIVSFGRRFENAR